MSKFTNYISDISGIELPQQFTFPFYYTPHPLAVLAAKELQGYIDCQKDWEHNFGNPEEPEQGAIGKMFGVLVVKNQAGEIGYLSAFSGKLADSNHHKRFVPPVYDMLVENDFFKREQVILNQWNAEIEVLESEPELVGLKEKVETLTVEFAAAVRKLQLENQALKKGRKEKRMSFQGDKNTDEYKKILDDLAKESVYRKFLLNDLRQKQKAEMDILESQIFEKEKRINELKEKRKTRSAKVQRQIFAKYNFLNTKKETKNLNDIFQSTFFQKPPAGAGECAAPKLLQYAFLHELEPIALAEFWKGQSPKSEIRKEGQFYPCCRGKCEPILAHMLNGVDIEPNPLLKNPAQNKDLEIIFEDEAIVVINKPYEFLSVPGKVIKDSVLTRLQALYPDCKGPLLLHRLDMSTSGILIMAKTEKYHKFIQQQFIKRTVQKRYVALLDGVLKTKKGKINLPLRGDLYDRPKQLVCFEHGKPAETDWEWVEEKDGYTKVYFYPKTGRTHQLRVHAAHQDGLNMPILGDDLYGRKSNRLHLHAAWISFRHPVSREMVEFFVEEEF